LSIFDRIKDAIFGEARAEPAEKTSADLSTPSTQSPVQEEAAVSPAPAATPAPAPAAGSTSAQPAVVQDTANGRASDTKRETTSIDVETMLDRAVARSGQQLDWRHSIVDLMKALGMDASLAERRELAGELGYTGDSGDSAKMNTFLHKALMKKLSENGGKVPAELID